MHVLWQRIYRDGIPTPDPEDCGMTEIVVFLVLVGTDHLIGKITS
jgi:hypothetical protein